MTDVGGLMLRAGAAVSWNVRAADEALRAAARGPSAEDLAMAAAARRASIDAARLAADPTVTKQQLVDRLDAIIALPSSTIGTEDFAFIAALERMTGEQAPRIAASSEPRGHLTPLVDRARLPMGAVFRNVETLRVGRVADLLATDESLDRRAIGMLLDEAIERQLSSSSNEDRRLIAAMHELPPERRPDLPNDGRGWMRLVHGLDPSHQERPLLTALAAHRDTVRITDPAATVADTSRILDRVLELPDTWIGPREMRQLALLEGLPTDRRPRFASGRPETFAELAARGSTPHGDVAAQVELAHLRTTLIQDDLLASPGFDAAAAQARFEEVLESPLPQLRTVRELTALATLPPTLRPTMPAALWRELEASGSLREYEQFDLQGRLRTWLVRERLAADPPVPQHVVDAVATRVAFMRRTDVTAHDVEQLAMLRELPTTRRPAGLPSIEAAEWRSKAAATRDLHRKDTRLLEMLAELRSWAFESPTGRTRLDADLASGAIEREVLDELVARSAPGVASPSTARPFSNEALLHASLRQVAAQGSRSDRSARASLERVRTLLDRLPPGSDAERRVHARVLELIDLNLRRTSGDLVDGLIYEPEYSELGRIASSGDLLLQMRATDVKRAVVEARAGVEQLQW